MTDRRHTIAAGPTFAEAKMLDIYDVFDHLLNSKPQQAKQLAYEVHTVALRYVLQSKQQQRNQE